jgi:hypothetical protein
VNTVTRKVRRVMETIADRREEKHKLRCEISGSDGGECEDYCLLGCLKDSIHIGLHFSFPPLPICMPNLSSSVL